MEYFFAIILFLLRAMIIQTAPMVPTSDGQTPPVPSIPTVQVQIPHPTQGVVVELKPQPQLSASDQAECPAEAQPGHCSVDTQGASCSQDCKASESDTNPPSEKPKVKTGWMNGLKNLVLVVCKTVSNAMVGEQGLLTNLGVATAPSKKKSKPKKSKDKTGGSPWIACCVTYQNGPPVEGDEDEEETKGQAQPISCYWIKNKIQSQTSVPGAPAPLIPAPLIPGAKTRTTSNSVNCCCTGPVTFKITKFIKAYIKPQFNCCAATVNLNLVEA